MVSWADKITNNSSRGQTLRVKFVVLVPINDDFRPSAAFAGLDIECFVNRKRVETISDFHSLLVVGKGIEPLCQD